MKSRLRIGIMGLVVAMSWNAGAGTTLVDSDFQDPIYANGTQNPTFAGWGWYSNPRARNNYNSSDVSGTYVAGSITNQVIQFEYTDDYGTNNISLSWTNTHTYVLRLNASPQSWNGTTIRYITPSLNQQDGTVLWAATNQLPLYSSFGRNPWTQTCTFEYVIEASDFTTGTEGQPLQVKVKSGGSRGTYVDNVSFVLTNLPADVTAPVPDPMTWDVEPAVENFTNNTMTATIATDSPYGVQYYFENTNTSGNSGWQEGPYGHIWTDVDLPPDSTNSYRVKARDKSPNLNETAWSAIVAVTNPPPDVTAPTPDPMTWATNPVVVSSRSVYMVATTATDPYLGVEYLFTNTTTGASSGWQSSPVWYQVHPGYDTSFAYRVKARDLSPNQNETAWSAEESVTVPTPNPSGLLVDESFQMPIVAEGTDLNNGAFFVGWSWVSGGGNIHVRVAPSQGAVGTATNRVIQYEQTSPEAIYDTDHLWGADEVYALTINASPMAWNGSIQRYLEPSLRETDNTLLWSTNVPVPLYDASFAGTNPWPESLTFEFNVNASEFVGGTEGQELRLKVVTTGQRGLLVDNIQLVSTIPPNAGTTFLFK